MSKQPIPDFVALARRYEQLPPGPKAELRRVVRPDDLGLIPAFYRLLSGVRINPQWQRIVYFLPFVHHAEGSSNLGQQLAGRVSEDRLFQVLRSTSPNDLIQLRRLVQQVEPRADWQKFGAMLYFWNESNKRRLVEDYFSPKSELEKDAAS